MNAPMNDLLVAAPLRLEALAIRWGAPGLRVRVTGMGPRRSLSAVPALAGEPAVGLVVMGVCGGLEESGEPGEVVVAERLLTLPVGGGKGGGRSEAGAAEALDCPSSQALVGALRERGVRVRAATVVSVDRIVRGEARARLARSGAAVADMESAWLARAAQGRPFGVIRVVADTPTREVTRPLLTLAGAGRAAVSLRRTAAALELVLRERGVHTVLGGTSA
jgi:4-hydroxy-3-methylbut-2-enyl diphosphate reductase